MLIRAIQSFAQCLTFFSLGIIFWSFVLLMFLPDATLTSMLTVF